MLRPDGLSHAPCINLDKTVKEDGNTKRLNMTFHATDDVMLYVTWSEGFRPGGINRRGTIPPYKADFLTNYEFGFKTTFANNRVRINGALFQDDWDDFQYSFLGQNGLTEIRNAGQARIRASRATSSGPSRCLHAVDFAVVARCVTTKADYCGVTYLQGPNEGQPVTIAPIRWRRPELACRHPAGRICRCSPLQRPTPSVATSSVGQSAVRTCRVRGCTKAARGPTCALPSVISWAKQPAYNIVDLRRWHRQRELGCRVVREERVRRARGDRAVRRVLDFPAGHRSTRPALCGLQPYTVTNTPRPSDHVPQTLLMHAHERFRARTPAVSAVHARNGARRRRGRPRTRGTRATRSASRWRTR
jgi:hypothetical protein